ncbi:hypothetical protein WMO13_05305 [Ignatzschineria larvae DSM 13226]|uniref:Uncharacterized protein n=1 Tax=Ignatzschineria larvae DSM 13226 TaxID=1111732 RepID=A0ABZ3C1Z9_9GAMM|nr:hypothetical protein [Ignatzschineria larvae]
MKLKYTLITSTNPADLGIPFVAVEADDLSLVFVEDAMSPEDAIASMIDEMEEPE